VDTAPIYGSGHSERVVVVASLGVSVTDEQADAVWGIAEKLAKDLEVQPDARATTWRRVAPDSAAWKYP
jgi:hypothetical protein